MLLHEKLDMLKVNRTRLEKEHPIPSHQPAPYTSSDFFKLKGGFACKENSRLSEEENKLQKQKLFDPDLRKEKQEIYEQVEVKPKAKRWDGHLSLECRNRVRATLKAVTSNLSATSSHTKSSEEEERDESVEKDMISLAVGRPSPEYYPWEAMAFHTQRTSGNIDASTCCASSASDSSSSPSSSSSSLQSLPTDVSHCAKTSPAYNLSVALNYGSATGDPHLLRFITEHIQLIHDPMYEDWSCCLTCGTTFAIDVVLRMLCDRGDCILMEGYTYPGTLEAAKGLGLIVKGIKMDQYGILPCDLERILLSEKAESESSDNKKGARKPPKVLYMIPTGQNPTGGTQTLERRKAIYEIAERYNLLIIEDDPYYFLQLGSKHDIDGIQHHDRDEISSLQGPKTHLDKYLQRLTSSYFSLDRSGRVIRLESTSKTLAPGLRCGWIVASSELIEHFRNHTEVSTVAPSGPSQMILYKLLDETWGHHGFIDWLDHLSLQYENRLNVLLTACEHSLPKKYCSWTVPTAGMFLWIRIDVNEHPRFENEIDHKQRLEAALGIEDRIYTAAIRNGVLVTKGSWFAVEKNFVDDVFFRLTFASAPQDVIAQAVHRLSEVLRKEFRRA